MVQTNSKKISYLYAITDGLEAIVNKSSVKTVRNLQVNSDKLSADENTVIKY